MLRVKRNQPALYEGIALLLSEPDRSRATVSDCGRHGDRTEYRELTVSEELNEWAQWPHLAQVGRLVRRCKHKGVVKVDVAYVITSLPPEQGSPERVMQLIREHWGIENRLHWIRDVTFDEDRCQVRTGAAPQVLAACRNLVIGLLRRKGATNIAAALRTGASYPKRAMALVTTP